MPEYLQKFVSQYIILHIVIIIMYDTSNSITPPFHPIQYLHIVPDLFPKAIC